MKESGRVPGKGRIPASIKKVSGRVLENGRVSVSTEKGSNKSESRKIEASGRVPGKVETMRVSKNCLGEYRKWVKWV